MTVELDDSTVTSERPAMPGAERVRTPLYVAPPSISPLRVVLVVPTRPPAWVSGFLALVSHNPWVEVAVLPFEAATAPKRRGVPVDLRAMLRYERRRLKADASAPPVLVPLHGVSVEAPLPADVDTTAVRGRVGLMRPDIVLLADAPQWAEALGDRAEWGCWQFDAGLVDRDHAALALLSPVMRGRVATRVELRLDQVGRPPTTLVTSVGATARGSLAVQVERAFRKLPALLLRALRQVACEVLDVPHRRTSTLRMCSGFGPIAPRVGLGVRTFGRTLAFRVATRQRLRAQPYHAPWHLLLRNSAEHLDPDAPSVTAPSLLVAPGDLYWADPCVASDQGRQFLFAEQWRRSDGKGEIVAIELLPDARARALGVVLERPYHLSFPQPFQWNGQWYMTVESGHDRSVTLYRADSFPLRWQPAATLVSGWHCVDPTLHHDGRHWYLWTTISESGGSTCEELFLFVADELAGPYRPHPANPIVSDARRARMAGRVFRRGGRLIRPTQDCAPTYGAALVFNEIVELSPTHYRERPLARLEPDWGSELDGCHTYNMADGIEVLDARGAPDPRSPRIPVVEPGEAERSRVPAASPAKAGTVWI